MRAVAPLSADGHSAGRDASTALVRCAFRAKNDPCSGRQSFSGPLPFSNYLFGAVDCFAGDHGPEDFGVTHFLGAYGQNVAIQQN